MGQSPFHLENSLDELQNFSTLKRSIGDSAICWWRSFYYLANFTAIPRPDRLAWFILTHIVTLG
ncbi:MAG: hypothetical protein CM1200mP41_22290 [Gammaproteobacteria bacterium]|nr:MAG: hypothetical protein CM1200mP41_22290 [Gammaproteobacteria bacterium]